MFREVSRSLRGVFRHTNAPAFNGPDARCATSVKESDLYSIWAPPHPLFTPWIGHPDFLSSYRDVAEHTYVSPDRCYILLSLAKHALLLSGDFAECGVCRGGTALLLSRIVQRTTSDQWLYLFDSFEGLGSADLDHDNYYKAGDFAFPNVEAVQALLAECERFHIIKGWIPETLTQVGNKQFAFVHIDVDLYRTALECCEFFYPRMVCGGVMVFDDYGFPACRGEKDAVDEFFARRLEKPIVLPTGQAILIKAVSTNNGVETRP
jgi:O-methyltransferase